MNRLIVMLNGRIEASYDLVRNDVSIGRKPGNEIRLNDSAVSGRHARIVQAERVYLVDEGSTNGTLLNGERVYRKVLAHGDVVQIGRFELKFEANVASGANDSQTMRRLRRYHAKPEGVLKVLEGEEPGSVVPLDRPFTSLGSEAERLAIVSRQTLGFSVRPLSGGGQEVRINGRGISGPAVLTHQDLIEVAGKKLRFLDPQRESA